MCRISKYIILSLFVFISWPSDLIGQTVIINEFMASNSYVLQDEDGDYPDWIELYNAADSTISLTGWYLSDDADTPMKWVFPELSLEPGTYLVVYASGKDRTDNPDSLHTNFKLSASGEFLALVKPDGQSFSTVFQPAYPAQFSNVSYGLLEAAYTFLDTPTPGAPNTNNRYILPPDLSVQHGHFFSPFILEITHDAASAEIYYTLNSGTPDAGSGILYTDPLEITGTTVIRARIYANGSESQTITQTYLFPEDIIHQPKYPDGYPEEWVEPVQGTDEHVPYPSDYGMHQDVVNEPTVSPVIEGALMDLPVVSLVSDIDHFFSMSTHPDSGGIYMYTGAPDGPTRNMEYHLGRGWERPASVEYFNSTDGSIDFQANCCMKLHGGATRTRYKTSKHSFRLGFSAEYGPTQLNENIFGEDSPDQFDWLILRGGFAPRYGLQIYDPWMKSAFRDMGQYGAYSQFVHLYLNGMYWGMYNLCERMDNNCMSDHFGGKPEEYDIMKDYYELEAGDTVAWAQLVELVQEEIDDPANYQHLLGNNTDGSPNDNIEAMVNAENLADYMLLNYYAGNTDWDHHNWVAARRRINSDGFTFIPWDGEYVLRYLYEDILSVNNEERPSGIFNDLMENPQFRQLFHESVSEHFFEGGALIPDKDYRRYVDWKNTIDTAIICESARWNSETAPKADIWETSFHTFIDTYFPERTEIVFRQLIQEEMYPEVALPEFNTNYRFIEEDFELMIHSPDGGEIRYTLDGSDPGYLVPGESENLFIYDDQALPFEHDTLAFRVRAKVNGIWSKLAKREFVILRDTSLLVPSLTAEWNTDLEIYPNPASEAVSICFSLKKESKVSMAFYNLRGECMMRAAENLFAAGEHRVFWNLEGLNPGVYLLVWENRSSAICKQAKVVVK